MSQIQISQQQAVFNTGLCPPLDAITLMHMAPVVVARLAAMVRAWLTHLNSIKAK
jgi:hypothetical protein